ncbi:PHP domain protein [Enterococcus faecalis 13-SD-W-01]|nr:PHP domain protein [Enterococcus faecalis 13-SD-W-01]
MKADLHVHSYYSDSDSSLKELLSLALKYRLNHLALVDHDTFSSFEESQKIFSSSPINLINGIEISAFDPKRKQPVRILGYNLKNRTYVHQLCEPVRRSRTKNTLQQLKIIQSEGYRISEVSLRENAGKASVLYPRHLFKTLTKNGYPQRAVAYLEQKMYKNKKPELVYADVYEAIEAIRLGGGMAVVAHPGKTKSYELIPELVSFGIDGIEKYHPAHQEKDRKIVQELLEFYQLSCFGGSDFKGKNGTHAFGENILTTPREFPDTILYN